MTEDQHIKILFDLEKDNDGFPPEDKEGIWAVALKSGHYRIDNIPFFVMGLSDGDIVAVEEKNGEYFFKKIITPSNNCTFRVIFFEKKKEDHYRDLLKTNNCRIEGTGIDGLISCSVHKNDYEAVLAILHEGFASGAFDYQESALR